MDFILVLYISIQDTYTHADIEDIGFLVTYIEHDDAYTEI